MIATADQSLIYNISFNRMLSCYRVNVSKISHCNLLQLSSLTLTSTFKLSKVLRGFFNYWSSNTTFLSNDSRLIYAELVGTKIRLEDLLVSPDLEPPLDDIE